METLFWEQLLGIISKLVPKRCNLNQIPIRIDTVVKIIAHNWKNRTLNHSYINISLQATEESARVVMYQKHREKVIENKREWDFKPGDEISKPSGRRSSDHPQLEELEPEKEGESVSSSSKQSVSSPTLS